MRARTSDDRSPAIGPRLTVRRPPDRPGSSHIAIAVAVCLLSGARVVSAQTTYYLHNESSFNFGLLQLKTAPPDTAVVVDLSRDLKGVGPTTDTLREFDTQPGVPGVGGVVPSNTTLTATLWMRKTSSYGTVFPYAEFFTEPSSGGPPFTAGLCNAQGGTALTMTLTSYTFSCTTNSAVTMLSTDHFVAIPGYVMTQGPGNKSMSVELDYEDTTKGMNASRVAIPNPTPPSITTLNPTSGPVNWGVTINGTNFGATQGSSQVTFFGTAATPTAWANGSISVPVPAGAMTGPVVVAVGGTPSNGVAFTVIPPPVLTSVTPTSAHIGDSVTLAGTHFLATQGSSTVTFHGTAATPTSWSDTSIVVPVPTNATSGNVVVMVSNQLSNGVPFSVIIPGSISGTVTRATGGTAVSGATVQAFLAGVLKATATTATNGTYTLGPVDPGTYDVRVTASGFSTEVRQGVTVSSNTTTTLNVTLSQPGAANGVVTQANGTTPIAGAAVTLYQNAVPAATTATNASGAYSLSNLHAGAYTLQVASAGYQTSESGISVAENATTTTNVSLNPAVAGQVTYVYDELGRLVSVIDPSGTAANYRYDAVGNILEIDRAGSSTVSISEFTPRSGPVGTTVVIFGTGYSTTPSSNTVTFNGTYPNPPVTATVTAATVNQLTTTVPAGATTGTIGVGTPNGSATSAATFTLTATGSLGPPTITSFSPAIWDGTSALTITGTNFDTTLINDRVSLNQALASPSAATSTSLTVPVPVSATSGHVVVATAAGTATSTADFYVPPPGFSSTTLDSTGRVTLGTSQTISFSAPNRYALRLFDGVAGHRVSALFSNVTVSSGSATLYDPYGRQVGSTGLVWPANLFIDAVTVVPGTYTLLVSAGSTGNATVTVYDFQDVTGTIAADGSTNNVSITFPGQNALLSFSTSVTERLSLVAGGNGVGGIVYLADARGRNISETQIGIFSSLVAPLSYAPGQYTVGVDFGGPATGTEAVNLWVVPNDLTGTITPGGPTVNANISAPGQKATYTIGTPTNSRVSLLIGAGPLGTVSVKNGTTTVTSGSINVISTFVEPWTFAAGQTLFVDVSGAGYGTVPLTAYDVPPDTTGTVTIGGPAATVTITAGGQNGTLTFSGTMNQPTVVHVTNNLLGSLTVRLVDTDRSTVLTSSSSNSSNFDLQSVTLPHTGTYTIQIDPPGANTGTVNINVSSP